MAVAIFAPLAHAGSATGTLGVTFNLGASCTTSELTPVVFPGEVAGSVTAESGTGSISVACSANANYTVALNAGLNPSVAGDTSTRRMVGFTNTSTYVTYDLYQNAGHSIHWGSTLGTDTLSATGTGSAQIYTVYGQIPTQSTSTSDAYADTVTITVNY